jgi:hypothetical protein
LADNYEKNSKSEEIIYDIVYNITELTSGYDLEEWTVIKALIRSSLIINVRSFANDTYVLQLVMINKKNQLLYLSINLNIDTI